MKDSSSEIDDTDKAILTELQNDSSISNVEAGSTHFAVTAGCSCAD